VVTTHQSGKKEFDAHWAVLSHDSLLLAHISASVKEQIADERAKLHQGTHSFHSTFGFGWGRDFGTSYPGYK
jgi:hypothetical protein